MRNERINQVLPEAIASIDDLHVWFAKMDIVNAGPNPSDPQQLEIMQTAAVLMPDRRDRKGRKIMTVNVDRRLLVSLREDNTVVVQSFEHGFSRTRGQLKGERKETPTRSLVIDANTQIGALSQNDRGLVDAAYVGSTIVKFLTGTLAVSSEVQANYQRIHANLKKYFPNHLHQIVG